MCTKRSSKQGASFWELVLRCFSPAITRHDLRELVRRGLRDCRGRYKSLLKLLGVSARDSRRLMFLAAHDCGVGVREFRGRSRFDALGEAGCVPGRRSVGTLTAAYHGMRQTAAGYRAVAFFLAVDVRWGGARPRAGRSRDDATRFPQARTIASRSASRASRPAFARCARWILGCTFCGGGSKSRPVEWIMPRSITFCQLRGCCRPHTASLQDVRHRRCDRRNRSPARPCAWVTQWSASTGISSTQSRSGGHPIEDVEAMVRIASERSVLDHALEIAVRRGDDPHVHALGSGAAEAFELAL